MKLADDFPGLATRKDGMLIIRTTKEGEIGNVTQFGKKLGIVDNKKHYQKVAHILIESGSLNQNDDLLIIGETTGVVEIKVNSFLRNDEAATSADKGNEVTFLVDELIRPRDKVYLFKDVKENTV